MELQLEETSTNESLKKIDAKICKLTNTCLLKEQLTLKAYLFCVHVAHVMNVTWNN